MIEESDVSSVNALNSWIEWHQARPKSRFLGINSRMDSELDLVDWRMAYGRFRIMA
jgi:hypothetical protein